jgi:hypothetical protein
MKKLIPIFITLLFIIGCNGGGDSAPAESSQETTVGATVEFTAPAPLAIPEYTTPKSDDDWKARVNNKNIEIIQVINIINPVAVFLTAGFEQYGDKIKNPTLHEEWADTQVQLTKALTLYDSCKKRTEAEKINKKLFLDHEDVWQLLVKTGVAGIRTKTMLDAELQKL